MSHPLDPSERAASALRGLFLGDALAMPVHWFYNTADIDAAFPNGIAGLEAPPEHHPSSIMSLHSTRGGGRSSVGSQQSPEVVGEVILKGKRQYWNRPNVHYHQGMAAGENTLNAHCTLALMQSMADNHGRYDSQRFLDAYVALMTAESPQHPDSYAESFHRAFFANWARGKPANQCAGVTHDTPSIGGLVMIAPIVFAERLAGQPLENVQALCRQHLFLTHPDESLAAVCRAYVQLLDHWLFQTEAVDLRQDLRGACAGLPSSKLDQLIDGGRPDREVIGRVLSSACYIDGAWPAILYLLARHAEQPLEALLANTKVGGDNVHRGAVLGCLLGLLHGPISPQLQGGLQQAERIEQSIEQVLG